MTLAMLVEQEKLKNTSQLANKKDNKDDATINEDDTGLGDETENA